MSDEQPRDAATKERSPKAPANTLEDCIAFLKKLYAEARRSYVKPEAAGRAMGYAGLTGSSLTLLASMSQYGLIDREKGNVMVSNLSVRILHPTSPDQFQGAIREAALAPKAFQELFDGYNDCSAEVLTSHLVQKEFNPNRAKRVAFVYTANKTFAKLDTISSFPSTTESLPETRSNEHNEIAPNPPPKPPPTAPLTRSADAVVPKGHKMLAQYSIPLGGNQATLVFTGKSLTPDDFDALRDYVELFKKQFVRAQKEPEQPAPDSDPAPEPEMELL